MIVALSVGDKIISDVTHTLDTSSPHEARHRATEKKDHFTLHSRLTRIHQHDFGSDTKAVQTKEQHDRLECDEFTPYDAVSLKHTHPTVVVTTHRHTQAVLPCQHDTTLFYANMDHKVSCHTNACIPKKEDALLANSVDTAVSPAAAMDSHSVDVDMKKELMYDHAVPTDVDLSLSENTPHVPIHRTTSTSLLPRDKTTLPRYPHLSWPCRDSYLCHMLVRVYERVYYALRVACARIVPYGGIASNCFSIASVTLGGGIISMPRSFATSGIIAGVLYLVVLGIMTVYTMTVMGYVLRYTGCQTFEQMATLLGGARCGHFVGFILWISCIGAAVGYISAVSSLIEPMVKHADSPMPAIFKSEMGIRVLTTMVWLLCMLPVIIPRRVNSIRYVSAIGCAMVMYFVVVTVVHSCRGGLRQGMRGDMKYFASGNEALYGLSIFMFGYLCQAMSHPVWFEMRPRRSVRQLTIASAIAVGVCMVFYILVGLFGYMDFGDETRDPVLYNFDPLHQPYIMIAYVGMLIKLVAAYAVNMIPCRNVVYDTLGWDLDTLPVHKHLIVVMTLSVLALALGLFIPKISIAFGLVGSLCGGFLGFIFPALFWMYCGNWSLKTVGIWHYLATYLLLISGVVAIVFGTIATTYSTFNQ